MADWTTWTVDGGEWKNIDPRKWAYYPDGMDWDDYQENVLKLHQIDELAISEHQHCKLYVKFDPESSIFPGEFGIEIAMGDDFQFVIAKHFPDALVISTLAFGVYMFAWEFFFRGLLIGGLRETFGSHAIVIQAVPFTLAHFGKPELEVFASFFVGLALGWIAYYGRTFLPAFVMHWIWHSTFEMLVVLWP